MNEGFSVFDWTRRLLDPDDSARLRVGSGASSRVYALASGFEIVAAKWYRGAIGEDSQFERELEGLRAVSHPNVIGLLGAGVARGRPALFLEYADGDLFEWIFEREPSEREARAVLAQLAAALRAVHAAGIAHRDVKCENVLLIEAESDAPTVKLADFGMSAPFAPGSKIVGDPCGSLEYCAPEIFDPAGYDERADVWSYGVVAFAVLTREAAFGIDSEMGIVETIRRAREETLSWDSGVGRALSAEARRFVEACLERDPRARPSSAALVDDRYLSPANPRGTSRGSERPTSGGRP